MRKKPKAFPPHFEKAKMCSKVMLYADRFYTSLQDSTRISKCSKDIINSRKEVCLCANARATTTLS